MEKLKSVVTGDIVHSSHLGKNGLTTLQEELSEVFQAENARFAFYRGDSFHAICEVEQGLRLAGKLRVRSQMGDKAAGATPTDIRMAIGIGRVEDPVVDLGTASGEAFVLSGRELDRLGKTGPRLSIICSDERINTGLAAIALFADYILRHITERQAAVLYELLQGHTQWEAAKSLNKKQSTISGHSQAANWKELTQLLHLYDKLTNNIIVEYRLA